jgi:hypothetical protein
MLLQNNILFGLSGSYSDEDMDAGLLSPFSDLRMEQYFPAKHRPLLKSQLGVRTGKKNFDNIFFYTA